MTANGGWDLVEPRVSIDPRKTPTADMNRAAAVNVAKAHLRGVPGLPDRAALVDVLEMLGLTGVGKKR